MARVNLLLIVFVLGSALYLVRTQYESRQLYTALDRAHSEMRRLDTEHDRLQVEKRAQATPLRVERLAKSELRMRTTTPAITQYVTYKAEMPVAKASAAASAATGGAR